MRSAIHHESCESFTTCRHRRKEARLPMGSTDSCTAAQAVNIGGSRSQPHGWLGIIQQGRYGLGVPDLMKVS